MNNKIILALSIIVLSFCVCIPTRADDLIDVNTEFSNHYGFNPYEGSYVYIYALPTSAEWSYGAAETLIGCRRPDCCYNIYTNHFVYRLDNGQLDYYSGRYADLNPNGSFSFGTIGQFRPYVMQEDSIVTENMRPVSWNNSTNCKIYDVSTDEQALALFESGADSVIDYYQGAYNSNIPVPKNLVLSCNTKLKSPASSSDVLETRWALSWDNENLLQYGLQMMFNSEVFLKPHWYSLTKETKMTGLFDLGNTYNDGYADLDLPRKLVDSARQFNEYNDVSFGFFDLYVRYYDLNTKDFGNWVKIHVIPSNSTSFSSMGTTSTTITNGYEEIEPGGELTPDSSYNNYSPPTADFNSNSVVSFISSGFGLLGNSGLIAMFSVIFTFLPPAFFSILLAGVGMLVVVGVMKAIF